MRSRQAQALPRLQSSTSPLHDHATPHHRTPPRHLRNTTSNRLKGGEEEEEKKNTSRNKQRNLYITPHHQNNPHTDRPNPKENKLVCLPVHTWCVLLANVPCACAIMHIGTKNGNTHALIHCAKRKRRWKEKHTPFAETSFLFFPFTHWISTKNALFQLFFAATRLATPRKHRCFLGAHQAHSYVAGRFLNLNLVSFTFTCRCIFFLHYRTKL